MAQQKIQHSTSKLQNDNVETRILQNPHFADHLRARLLRRASPAVRAMLANLNDTQLIEIYFANEARGREHAENRRAEKAMSE